MNALFKDENAVYYECGFSCDNELFLSLKDERYFITDPRYTTEAKEKVQGAEVVEARDINKKAREILRKKRVKKLFYDPKELHCQDLEAVRSKLDTKFCPKPNLSWQKRLIKSEKEIRLIRRSVQLNAEAFDQFAAFVRGCEGWSERRLHFEAIGFLSRKGEYELSFDPIFAIDENGAKPHAYPSKKRLHEGALVLFDAGIKYERYCSDRTRTASFGGGFDFDKEEQKFKNPKVQRAYDIVKKAQESAIKAAKSGMRAKDLDKIARDIIDGSEFAGCFIHSLGHGVGLDIHEMPFINSKNEQILEDGMVFTIEPGIYVPGEFGIRIEDMVVLQNGRAEVL